MRVVGVAALAVCCAAVAVCPADRPSAASADAAAAVGGTAADLGLEATLTRSRLFETRRSLRAVLRSIGDRDVHVEAVRLDSPLFTDVEPQPRDPVVRAGGRSVAMPLAFGEARCDGDTDGPAQLVVTADGRDIAVPLDESPAGLLAELHGDECAVAAVREDVDLRLADGWQRTDDRTVTGDIVMTQRRPGVELAVEGLEGNVIFTLVVEDGTTGGGTAGSDTTGGDTTSGSGEAADAAPVLAVDDERPEASVRASITASRCDPHALIEYKRTFIFVALVDIGEDRPLRVDLPAEGDNRRLFEAVLQACL